MPFLNSPLPPFNKPQPTGACVSRPEGQPVRPEGQQVRLARSESQAARP